jgi:uncharacterized protein YukE
MLMSKIVASTDDLDNYAAKLESFASEFSGILGSMDGIVGSISGSWDGIDSETFIGNATAYIHNLKAVENALLQYANIVKNCSVDYNNRVADFYDLLG